MANFQYHVLIMSLMKFVLYLSSLLILLPWKSDADQVTYLKSNLIFLSPEFDRPYAAQIFVGTPAQKMELGINTISDIVRFPCGVEEGETMPREQSLIDTMPSGDFIPPAAGQFYDIAKSSTFSHVFCNSTTDHDHVCPARFQANRPHDCSNETYCVLPSDTTGHTNTMYWITDNLNLNEEYYSTFTFACDQYHEGENADQSFRGVLGLSRTDTSFFSQFGQMFDYCLSYCLPLNSTSNGYLAFGLQNNKCLGGGDDASLVLTDLIVHPNYPSSYLINITSITVNTTRISINSSSGIFLNPATYFTSLPIEVYQAMREKFLESNNPISHPGEVYDGKLDLCFNTSNGGLNIPRVSMTFANNVTVEVDHEFGIIYVVDETTSCLGFFGNDDIDAPGVLGGMQQANLEVGIDLANNKVGFRPKTACW